MFKKIVVLFICVVFSAAAPAAMDVSTSLRGPKTPDHAQIIKNYLENEQYTDAMLELNKALSTEPDNPQIYVLGAELLRKTGELEQAEKLSEEALKLDYKNTDAYLALGYTYLNMGNTREEKRENITKAFDHFFIAAQYDPANPFPHIALAEAYHNNFQKQRAKDEILKAQELSFNNPEAQYGIGQFYYKIGDSYKAEKYIQKSLDGGRDNYYKAHLDMGKILEQKGEIKMAQQKYLQALKLKPDLKEAQERLDALIKTKYKQNLAEQSQPKDILETVDQDLKYLMKADYYLMLDQITEARDLYVKLLEKDPGNFMAAAGLAELYYSKWKSGLISSKNFTSDSIFIIKSQTNKKNEIALLKFQMINQNKIPEKVRQRLINLSITESFDYYDLLNEIRAEFLLGNYVECHNKLLRLLEMKLSNYEKFKVLKHLTYDNNYYEALLVLRELEKTYYHNEEIEPVEKRIKAKFQVSGEKLKEARALYEDEEYNAAALIYEELTGYFPTYKDTYLHYSDTLEAMENYEQAYESMNTYYKLYKLYPDKDPEISEDEIKAKIKDLYRQIKAQR